VSIFKAKKFTPVEEISIPDEWAVFQGEHQSKPLLARFRKTALQLAGHPSFAHQVGIAVPLKHPDANGFPTAEESQDLNRIEDLISDKLQSQNESILVGVISTNGMREFVLYTTKPEHVKSKVETISKAVPTHTLQLMIQPDKDWKVLKSFIK